MSAEVRVDVDDSPVYEVLLGLYLYARPDEFQTDEPDPPRRTPRGQAWSAAHQQALEQLGGGSCPWDQLLGLAAHLPAPRTIARFLECIAQTDHAELLAHLCGYYATRPQPHLLPLIADAEGGSRSARRMVLNTLAGNDAPRRAALERLFGMDAAELRALISLTVRGWYEDVVQPDEEQVLAQLATDASAKRALSITSPELLIRVTTGVRYVPRPWVESVLLVPSVVLRPWLVAIDYRRSRIYCYTIPDDTPGGPTMPPPPVVRVYRALGHAMRLRILRSLAGRPMTLAQLCGELDAPELVVRPHLALLRAAGLVWITCAAEMTYELRHDVVAMAGHPLQAYLDAADRLQPASGGKDAVMRRLE